MPMPVLVFRLVTLDSSSGRLRVCDPARLELAILAGRFCQAFLWPMPEGTIPIHVPVQRFFFEPLVKL